MALRKSVVLCLAIFSLFSQGAVAAPTTLTFEGISNGLPVDDFYSVLGITFDDAAFAFTGFAAAPSPVTVVSNFGCSVDCEIDMTSTTGFTGAVNLWHTGFGAIAVSIFASGNLVTPIASATYQGPNAAWVEESLPFAGVGAVVHITGLDAIGSFALDNMTLNLSTSAVPEPATLALLGIGLAGLGFARRKQ